MKKIVSGTDMKMVDRYTIDEIGISSMVLMERAAYAVSECIKKNESATKNVIVVTSTGNNGADGLAISRMLYLLGYDTCIYILGDKNKGSEEFLEQLKICEKLKIPFTDSYENRDIVVDAIFGVGLSRNVEGQYAEVISEINDNANKVYAVDIPSGISADTGKVCGIAVRADKTITFGCHKIGTVLYPGAEYCGEIEVADIGFAPQSYSKVPYFSYCTKDDLQRIPKRPNYSNKGTFGKVLVIAGSKDISGAAYLCAKAALKCGAGMVRVLTAKENREVIQKLLPEAMVDLYDVDNYDNKVLTSALCWSDVVAIGPGLSVGEIQKDILSQVLVSNLPTVIDADGINNLSGDDHLIEKLHKNVIITPHLREMSRLLNIPTKEIASDLIDCLKKSYDRFHVDCVLKDARSVIVSEGKYYVNMTGNCGMATAGSGDVLTGIIAGLLGIGVDFHVATTLGPYIHGLAGDMAERKHGKAGMLASDIIDELESIFK